MFPFEEKRRGISGYNQNRREEAFQVPIKREETFQVAIRREEAFQVAIKREETFQVAIRREEAFQVAIRREEAFQVAICFARTTKITNDVVEQGVTLGSSCYHSH